METNDHPISAMAFFNTTAAEIKEMTAIYTELVGSDPTKAAHLMVLLKWAGEQAACEESYNNTDFSP